MSTRTTAVTCPSCGASVPAARDGRTSKCSYCDADLIVEESGLEDGPNTFPHFAANPIPCPTCHKKALRPRVRTKDFRCQACSKMFPRQEIEDLAASWVSPERQEGARVTLISEFQRYERLWGYRRGLSLAVGVANLGLHPDDVHSIVDLYRQAKEVRLEFDDIQGVVAEARLAKFHKEDGKGFSIKPPERAKDASGLMKNWDELLPDERAQAFALHRNAAIAAIFANRERVAHAIKRKFGCKRGVAAEVAEKVLTGEMEVADISSECAAAATEAGSREAGGEGKVRRGLPAVLWVVAIGVLAFGGWWLINR